MSVLSVEKVSRSLGIRLTYLYNPIPDEAKVIAYIDSSTYLKIEKKKKNKLLVRPIARISSSQVKPILIVAPFGYILSIDWVLNLF